MKSTYTLLQQYITYILLVSLFLQSCGGLDHPITPIEKTLVKAIQTHHQAIIRQNNIDHFLGKALVIQGEHMVGFYEEEGKLKANVAINVPKGFSKTYPGIEVSIAPGTNCLKLLRLNKQAQKRRIYFQLAHNGYPTSIIICQDAGLRGGMYVEEEEEEEREAYNEGSIPNEFFCPITHEVMEDPVIAQDGHTYERKAIERWFAMGKCTSPKTGASLMSIQLTPNHTMQRLIQDIKAQVPVLARHQLVLQNIDQTIQLRKEELEEKLAQKEGLIAKGGHAIFKEDKSKGKEKLKDEDQEDQGEGMTSSRNGEQATPDPYSIYVKAIKEEDQMIENYIKRLPNAQFMINGLDTEGNTALHLAIKQVDIFLKKLLDELGIDIQNLDNKSLQCLAVSAIRKSYLPTIIDLLKTFPAAVTVNDQNGRTPLHLVAENGYIELVQYLIDNGAEKNARDNDGSTPLHIATEKGHIELVKYLIDKGANKEAKDNVGKAPLHIATEKGHIELVKYLIDKGANKEAKDNEGANKEAKDNYDPILAHWENWNYFHGRPPCF